MSEKENNFENTFADSLEGEDEWDNKIDGRLNTEAAKRIYKRIRRETEKDLRNVNDLMAEYYRDNEKELKTELKDEDKFSRGDKEYGFKKQIENGNINSSTLEIFVARYSWMIFKGESKGNAIESILRSLSNFTQTFEKAVEKEYEMNLDNGAEKEINEEDENYIETDEIIENGELNEELTREEAKIMVEDVYKYEFLPKNS